MFIVAQNEMRLAQRLVNNKLQRRQCRVRGIMGVGWGRIAEILIVVLNLDLKFNLWHIVVGKKSKNIELRARS